MSLFVRLLIAGIVFILFRSMFEIHRHMRLNRKQAMMTSFWSALLSAIITFQIKPPNGWDLYRHFIWMDQIRNSGISFFQLLFDNPLAIGNYPTLVSFNILRYVLCKVTKNNQWLPFVCTFITYLAVGYIMVDWRYKKKIKDNMLSLLLCISFLPPFFVVAGVRTSLAAAIMGYAIYVYIYKGCNFIAFMGLVAISVTIHQVFLIAVPFAILSNISVGRKGVLLVVAVSFSLRKIAELLLHSRSSFLSTISRLYFTYTSESQYRGSEYSLWGDIALLFIFLALLLKVTNKSEENLWDKKEKNCKIFYYIIYVLL